MKMLKKMSTCSWRHFSHLIILTIGFLKIVSVSGNTLGPYGVYRLQESAAPTSLALDSPCRSTLECLLFVPNSQCDWNQRTCTCRHKHVRYNDTMCLPPSLLTYGCTVDEQCQAKVPNSRCVEGLCQCQPNFVPLRFDKCLPPSQVHDYCLTDHQCHLGSKYSYCKYIIPRAYGKCQCPLNYVVTSQRTCLPHLTSPCESNEDCESTTPNAHCNKEPGGPVCRCQPGYVTSRNGLLCEPEPQPEPETEIIIKEADSVTTLETSASLPVSLGHRCNSSAECQARDVNSACVDGICNCVKPTSTCNAINTGCKNDTFQCKNGQCISWYFVCDGQNNCADGSDEEFCNAEECPREAFRCNDGTCLSRATVCNGRWECPDGSDEARCYKGIPCDPDAFRCASGQCLPLYTFCNAVIDCMDGSDELEDVCDKGDKCPINSFQCDNNRCRSSAILCSGVDGCGDNSDETGCEVCQCEKP